MINFCNKIFFNSHLPRLMGLDKTTETSKAKARVS